MAPRRHLAATFLPLASMYGVKLHKAHHGTPWRSMARYGVTLRYGVMALSFLRHAMETAPCDYDMVIVAGQGRYLTPVFGLILETMPCDYDMVIVVDHCRTSTTTFCLVLATLPSESDTCHNRWSLSPAPFWAPSWVLIPLVSHALNVTHPKSGPKCQTWLRLGHLQ
ncbi:hypothetical protein L6452_03120 [Arctium lappa]|uniref:Uncharacterized protein n=1 Tax=Arctium lappa TaxID=4217 RepID=A0ACB9FMC1_ARCLA|nr:hypothetical protein L6452_03120 [Arctium lappa]